MPSVKEIVKIGIIALAVVGIANRTALGKQVTGLSGSGGWSLFG